VCVLVVCRRGLESRAEQRLLRLPAMLSRRGFEYRGCLAGILMLVFLILIIVTSFITIALTYFQVLMCLG
jgi:hypothetical protein